MQMGFTQMTLDFRVAIKALTESPGQITEFPADFWVVSSASVRSVYNQDRRCYWSFKILMMVE